MSQPLTDQQLAAIQAREAAAWRGPWTVQNIPAAAFLEIGTPDGPIAQVSVHLRADAEFIAGARQDIPALLAEVQHLRAEVLTARAAGYRSASNDVAELRALHGQDFDTDMVMVVLDRGAELREAHAAQAALTAPACSCGAEQVHQHGCGGEAVEQPAAGSTLAEQASRAIFGHVRAGDFGNAERVLTEYANDTNKER